MYYIIKIDENRTNNTPSCNVNLVASFESEEEFESLLKEKLEKWYSDDDMYDNSANDIYDIYNFKKGIVRFRGYLNISEEEYNVLRKYLTDIKDI